MGSGSSSVDGTVSPIYAAACDGSLGVSAGIDLPEELAEISGVAPSSTRTDVVWAIGDGGSAASVFAVDLEGNIVSAVAVAGVENNDWEDLAAGPAMDGSGGRWLYVADIGDNTSERERIRIQAFPEPDLGAAEVEPRTILAHYSTGATDAEALSVTDDGFWILGKQWGGESAPLYHLPFAEVAPTDGSSMSVFEPTDAEVDTEGDLVTAMDAAPSTGTFAVRSYGELRLFAQESPDLTKVAESKPCLAPPFVEGQGESVAVLADGATLVTASEAGATRPAELHILRPKS